MKRITLYFTLLISIFFLNPKYSYAQMLITGVIDGDMPGGTPKAIEFFVTAPISDLSEYGFGVAQNGTGTDGQEYTFNGTAQQGDFFYFAHSANNGIANFQTFFGFSPDFAAGNGILAFNGNDAIELYRNGHVIDVFGQPSHGGNPSWTYTNGWAQRNDFSAPSGNSFSSGDWSINNGALEDGTVNGNNGTTPFPIGQYNHGPLPVVLTHFNAKLQQKSIILNWTTAQEINNAYFEIERSSNQSSWKSIGQIGGAGTTTDSRKYFFLDTHPAYGENVYRLKQVDIDGSYTYSSLASVSLEQIRVQVFPNPFTANVQINVRAPQGERIQFALFDMMGKQVKNWAKNHQKDIYDLGLAQELAPGIYYLKVEIDSSLHLVKLVKQ